MRDRAAGRDAAHRESSSRACKRLSAGRGSSERHGEVACRCFRLPARGAGGAPVPRRARVLNDRAFAPPIPEHAPDVRESLVILHQLEQRNRRSSTSLELVDRRAGLEIEAVRRARRFGECLTGLGRPPPLLVGGRGGVDRRAFRRSVPRTTPCVRSTSRSDVESRGVGSARAPARRNWAARASLARAVRALSRVRETPRTLSQLRVGTAEPGPRAGGLGSSGNHRAVQLDEISVSLLQPGGEALCGSSRSRPAIERRRRRRPRRAGAVAAKAPPAGLFRLRLDETFTSAVSRRPGRARQSESGSTAPSEEGLSRPLRSSSTGIVQRLELIDAQPEAPRVVGGTYTPPAGFLSHCDDLVTKSGFPFGSGTIFCAARH